MNHKIKRKITNPIVRRTISGTIMRYDYRIRRTKRNKSEKTSFFPKISSFVDFLQKVIILLVTIFMIIAFCFIIYSSLYKEMIVIDRFTVSKQIEDLGFTNQALEYQISDKIIKIVKGSTSIKKYDPVLTYDKIPQVEIQQGGIKFKSFVQSIENYFGEKRKFVNGELTSEKDGQINLTIRVEGHEAKRLTESKENMDQLLHEAAIYIMRKTEPYILAAYYQMNKEYDKVLDLIQYCIHSNRPSDEHWAYNLWGIHLLENDEHLKAIVKFEKATQIEPNFGIAYFNWGIALEAVDESCDESIEPSIKNCQKVIEKYQKASTLLPDFAPLYHTWGLALLKQQEYEKAIEKFNYVKTIDPKNGTVWKDLGYSYMQIQDFEQAEQALALAAELSPFDPKVFYFWARSKRKLGFNNEAEEINYETIEICKRLMNKNPKTPELYFYWGLTLEDLKMKDDAVLKYKQALDIDSDYPYAKKALERLKNEN